MHHRPQHAPLTQFPVNDDALMVGGITVAALTERVGQTPFYAYDAGAISDRVAQLRAALPPAISIHYAIKANPMPDVVKLLAAQVDGLDVASAGELELALASAAGPDDISFAGPGKTDAELRWAIEAGITLNVESRGELRRAVAVGAGIGIEPRVAIRVNPDFALKSSGMQMGGGPKAFGVDAEAVPDLLHAPEMADVHFRGLHIYGGSQNLQAEHLIAAYRATFELAYRLAEDAPSGFETLNIGGGFGIPYFPGEQPLDIERIGGALADQLLHCRECLGPVEVIIELGRYLVGEAGIYVCRVIDKKVSRGQTFLVTDGGLHQHLAASGNFGQVIRKNFPVVTAHRVFGEPRETVNVVGPLCTPLDVLGERIELGVAEAGDLIVVLQSGAYGFSASPLAFLGHPPPAQILV